MSTIVSTTVLVLGGWGWGVGGQAHHQRLSHFVRGALYNTVQQLFLLRSGALQPDVSSDLVTGSIFPRHARAASVLVSTRGPAATTTSWTTRPVVRGGTTTVHTTAGGLRSWAETSRLWPTAGARCVASGRDDSHYPQSAVTLRLPSGGEVT